MAREPCRDTLPVGAPPSPTDIAPSCREPVLPARRARFWVFNATSLPRGRAQRRQGRVEVSESAATAKTPGDRLALVAATWFGSGFLPLAPGTWGSFFSIPVFVLFSCFAGSGMGAFLGLLGATFALFVLGVWSAGRAEELLGRADDGRIVIDEVVGQLLAWAPLSLHAKSAAPILTSDTAGAVGSGLNLIFFVGLVTGFVAFRCFDIAKPGPVRWAEQRYHGGLGVMLDDVVAGVLAAGVVAALLVALAGFGLVGATDVAANGAPA